MANDSVEWTSEQMIENANNWSLCGDVAVFNRLKKFSQTVISGAETLNTNVDKLLNSLEEINLKLELTKNEFHSLRNTQFIENRVYEDDETLETDENKQAEAKESTDEEKEIALKKSIAKGLEIMDKYFDKVELAISDSEGESNEKSYVMQPKDPYANRPLPYVVGTQEWYKKWHVGLLLSESEAESEPEEEVYSSGDSENDLPKNRIPSSETSSELGFTNTDLDPEAHSTFNDSRDPNRLHYSSDEGSEQSSSVHSKAPISKQSFAEQLAAKLGDVVSNQIKESDTRTKPATKSVPRGKYGNLFSDEPPPLDELDDAMLPKTARQGLFTAGRDLFAENKNDPSWASPQENNRTERSKSDNPPTSTTSTVSKPKVPKGLFDNSDSSSEEDLLAITEKRKFMNIPPVNPYMQPSKPTVPFVDDEPPELITKDEVRSSKKKPVGGKAIFGENANIFVGKPALSEKCQTAKPDTIEPSKEVKKASLFDDSSDDEMFVPKPKALPSAEPSMTSNAKKPLGLFEDILPQDAKSHLSGKKLSLFDDDDDPLPSNMDKSAKNDESFDKPMYGSSKSTTAEPKDKIKPKKISLFDDDDDLLKEEEDIFSGISKKSNLFEGLRGTSSKLSQGLFSDAEDSSYSVDLRAEKESVDVPKSLFGDAGNVSESLKPSLAKQPAKSLFDDSDNSDEDFFSPKSKAEVGAAVADIKIVRSETNTNLDVVNDQEKAEKPIEYLSSNPAPTIADRRKDEVKFDVKEVDCDARNQEIDTRSAVLFEGKSLSTSLLDEEVLIGERDETLEIDQQSAVDELKSTNPAQVQQKIWLNDNEEVSNESNANKPLEDTSVLNESQPNFVTPPPINLFDPTPPPVDWDASSDNSGESDTFSLSDGILERANYNQSQSTSSVFDEAPPVLPIFEISDMNHSSGIVKDMSASMVDTRTFNLFSPSASSTRRRSSDIFQEQQSQDNLFLTKSRNVSLQAPNLSSITEQLEQTSKISQITPSGTIGDFEQDSSSVFEEIEAESSVNMSHSKVDVSKKKSFFSGDPEQKADEDGNKADLKPSPGKLKHNLNINVGALLPGAAPSKNRITKATSLDENVQTIPPKVILRPKPPVSLARPKSEIVLRKHTPESLEDNFEDLGGTEVLHSITKDRAKIPLKRRPSTRRARQEAVRKSMTDFRLYTEHASVSDESQNMESINDGSSGGLSNKFEQIENDKSPDFAPVETKGISLVFDNIASEKSDIFIKQDASPKVISKLEQITDMEENDLCSKSEQAGKSYEVNTSSREKGNKEPIDVFQKSLEDCENVKLLNEDKLEVISENPPNIVKKAGVAHESTETGRKESKSIFEDSIEDDLFKSSPKVKNPRSDDGLFKSADSFKSESFQPPQSTASSSNIFGEDLPNRAEDLFTGTSKSAKKADGVLPVTKIENLSSFLDGSGSDSDGDLFGGKSTKAFIPTKAKASQPIKKKSIFNDSEGSSEDDLFGAQTRKSGLLSSADIKGAEGNTKRPEIKTANIKKLESKQVTDFDPLSGFK